MHQQPGPSEGNQEVGNGVPEAGLSCLLSPAEMDGRKHHSHSHPKPLPTRQPTNVTSSSSPASHLHTPDFTQKSSIIFDKDQITLNLIS